MDNKYQAEFSLTSTEAEELLNSSELNVLGQIENSSNSTLLVELDGSSHKGIYKPVDGERPLHDFPPGLHHRELAAYLLSQLLDWDLVPPTQVVDGPFGEGSLQLFVEADFQEHYFSLVESDQFQSELRKIALFDYIANNTDRKSSHCLLGSAGIWGIDQGLCFHAQYKLRTVIWEYAGQAIDEAELSSLKKCLDGLEALDGILTTIEVDAIETRCKALVKHGMFVEDETGGARYPWPPI